jgi:hypothetical protein
MTARRVRHQECGAAEARDIAMVRVDHQGSRQD